MKKFYFSLNKVLAYKEQTEESLRNEYMQKVALVREQEQIIESLYAKYDEHCQTLEEGKAQGCTISFMKLYEMYLGNLQIQIDKEKEILVCLKEEEEKKRQELMKAKIEKASIEKLKEKKEQEYQKMIQKQEELLVEEFVSNISSLKKIGVS